MTKPTYTLYARRPDRPAPAPVARGMSAEQALHAFGYLGRAVRSGELLEFKIVDSDGNPVKKEALYAD